MSRRARERRDKRAPLLCQLSVLRSVHWPRPIAQWTGGGLAPKASPATASSPASPESFTLKTLETTDEASSC